MFARNVLAFFGVEVLQVGLGHRTGALLVHVLVHHRNGGLGYRSPTDSKTIIFPNVTLAPVVPGEEGVEFDDLVHYDPDLPNFNSERLNDAVFKSIPNFWDLDIIVPLLTPPEAEEAVIDTGVPSVVINFGEGAVLDKTYAITEASRWFVRFDDEEYPVLSAEVDPENPNLLTLTLDTPTANEGADVVTYNGADGLNGENGAAVGAINLEPSEAP